MSRLIRSYAMHRPMFLDGGPDVAHYLTILPASPWHQRERAHLYVDQVGSIPRIMDGAAAARVLRRWRAEGRSITCLRTRPLD